MPEFNNIKYDLNDGEKFALVCGMLAGLRLQDKTRPPSKVIVNLEPIGVGGLGGIGLMASDIYYDGNNKISIPILTHDVDREYSGFSLLVSYDNSRIVVNSVSEGEFGSLDITRIESGKTYVGAMLDEGEFKKEPCIVCYLNCTILDPPTKGNPIEIKFENGSGYDINYCSLLTWVLNETDNNYYSYFITPTVNTGCLITSDEEKKVENNLMEEQVVAAEASPSLIDIGESYIEPGLSAAVPIYTNINTQNNVWYNRFNTTFMIPKDYVDIIHILYMKGIGGWELTYESDYDDEGNLIVQVQGDKEEAITGYAAPGFILFSASLFGVEKIDCLIKNIYSEVSGPYNTLEVLPCDGYLYYPTKSDNDPNNDKNNNNNNNNNNIPNKNYIDGNGKIYSSTAQIIFINVGDSIKYPVVLEPGWNDVHIHIPIIRPDDVWEETTITIESEGYILIPGGFEWEIIVSPEAPLGLSSPRLLDRFEIKDVYDILQEVKPIPVDLDGIFDNIKLVDEIKTDLLKVAQRVFDGIDEAMLEDLLSIDIETTPREPMIFDENSVEEAEYVDITLINKVEVNIGDTVEYETAEAVDFIDLEIESSNT